jgi:hypothetical protein
MTHRTVRGTALIGSLTLVLVAVGGWLLFLGPATGALHAARQELIDSRDANALLQARLSGLQQQAAQLGVVAETETRLATVFPTTADQPGFFRLVDRAASEAGIPPTQITTLSPAAPVLLLPVVADAPATGDPVSSPDSQLATQTVTVNVDTSYAAAARLLANLEEMDRALLIHSVEISSEATGPDVTMSITGSTFVAAPVPAPALEKTS